MRNLKLDAVKIEDLPINEKDVERCIKVNDIYFLLSNSKVHYVKNDTDVIIQNDINSIDWIPIENVLYMGNGKLFNCFNLETEETNTIEIPGGYIIHEWNPSQDRVALIDNNGLLKIVLLDAYNCHYTFINEYQLDQLESSPFINIGWGSQNTQFRGSEGKLKKQNIQDDKSSTDDNIIRIAWRDDGDIFAVSFIRNSQRIFKIFSCECEFLYENEYKSGLQAEIAWKPDGSMLAAETQLQDKYRIMFFEKNGLYRFELPLPVQKKIRKIQWNPTGDILMVWQESSDNSEISLWTFTNYNWYLKQNLLFNYDDKVNYTNWKNKKFLEVITSKHVINYSWRFQTCISTESVNDKLGAIVVIDGCNLRVTVTSAQIIPPPYSSYNIEFDKPVNNIVFGNSNSLVVVFNDNTIKLLEISVLNSKEIFSGKIDLAIYPLQLNNFVYNHDKCILYCVKSSMDDDHCYSIVYEIHVDDILTKISPIITWVRIKDLLNVQNKLAFLAGNQVFISMPYNGASPECELDFIKGDSEEVTGHNSVKYINDLYYVFSLQGQRFYYNGIQVANNITSYLLYNEYLLLTTTENKLLYVKLSNLDDNLNNVYTRNIPSGAILITVVPGTRKLILQVPRGELETINLRVLAIEEIDRLLSIEKYLEAYKIIRTDRINPNLLYDINPKRFLDNIKGFIKDINSCEYLDVFLTQLQQNNITEELYSNCFKNPLPVQSNNKISLIANRLIETMKQIDIDYYLQSIITAYLCKGTDEDLEKALNELFAAKQREENGGKFQQPVESTLEHMIILTSVEKLYDIALGMDKLVLIMWIASKSQLDPLEYIPFLRELINMEDNYRNYKINYHIKRFEKSLTFLLNCNDVLSELTELISQNNLYSVLLKHLKPNNQWYEPLLEFYGKYLQNERRYQESGIIFMKINRYRDALENFAQGTCLKEALTAFCQLGSPVGQYTDILLGLATRLVDKKLYKDASFLYDSFLNNYEEAISVLIQGYLWSDAFFLAIKYNRNDIIETDIKPSLQKEAHELSSNLKFLEDEFSMRILRLKVIREERIEKVKQFGNNFHTNEFSEKFDSLNIDLESVVSTNYSRASHRSKASQYSSASSRRKKRIERKVLQIRPGSAFENIGLLRRLYCIIVEVQNLREIISNLCSHLVLFSEFVNIALDLQVEYKKIFDVVTASKDAIWPQEMLIPPEPVTVESRVYRENIEYLENQCRYPPSSIEYQEFFTL